MTAPRPTRGPFRADQLTESDRYELTQGHAVYCAPAGGRHAETNVTGALPLATDPAVTEAGIDPGYALAPGTLRAPDIAVGNVPSRPGWVAGAPPLAVEYADTGTEEADLQTKIAELLEAGTQHVWVVRLVGPRRVEVYEPGRPVRTVGPGHALTAPGILANAVPVEALWDRRAAHEVALRNLLQRRGYADLDALRTEGEAVGRTEGEASGRRDVLLQQFARRLGRALTDAERTVLDQRLATSGAGRLSEVVLDGDRASVAAWLGDPAAGLPPPTRSARGR